MKWIQALVAIHCSFNCSFSYAVTTDPTAWVTTETKTRLMKMPTIQREIAKIPNLDTVTCAPPKEDDVSIYSEESTAPATLLKFEMKIYCKVNKGRPPNAFIQVDGQLDGKTHRLLVSGLEAQLVIIPCSKLGSRFHSKPAGCR